MLCGVTVYAADLPSAAKLSGLLSERTQVATEAGTTLEGPRNWTVRRNGALLILDAPETDTHVVILDTEAADAKEAVAALWARYRPDAKLPIRTVTKAAPRQGWDERATIEYETAPGDRRTVVAQAARKGSAWNVMLVDASDQTAEKRGAALQLISNSLRPAGYMVENVAASSPHRLDAARIAAMRAFVTEAAKELQIPGASFALLDGGKVVYEGGVGVRDLEKRTPVDANTLFMAASNTKGMTTLLLATLADEGKLRWDQPVIELLPSFRLGDDTVTKQVQVRHLVCACTGLPRQDLEWLFEYKNATAARSVAMLSTNKPTSAFGEVFQYNNLMASAAGYMAGHVAYPNLELGAAYDRAMHDRVFKPLGMNRTTFDMKRALATNHASPYSSSLDGDPVLVDIGTNYSVVPHRPAGGAWTSAHDLIRYVQLEADKGATPQGRVVSERNLLMRRAPGVAMGENGFYGMGLMMDKVAGVPAIFHGGSLFGYKSNIYLLPDAGVGAVLLTNSDSGRQLLRPFLRRLVELVYDAKPEAEEDVRASAAKLRQEHAAWRAQLNVPADPARSAMLASHYHSPELGDLTVRKNGSQIIFNVGEWQTEVATRKETDGTVSFVSIAPGMQDLPFVVEEGDGKRRLIVRDGQHEYVFTEVAG
jgi:CubicO group peptidase (beta-lactamase class C family)